MMVNENLELKAVDTMEEVRDLEEDEIIRQVAEEEGMDYEEVKEIWETFKNEAMSVVSKRKKNGTKSHTNKAKKKSKNKQAKASRKRNR